ncbi:glycosyltransferase [Flavobacterium sp. FZUC8N2.13]|uniref:Glycosyltransferase n=1 Tax=Flavobacterium zubiriense TaxID=3138075 RepID=A0ABV4T7J0_9FLAO
MFLSIIIPVYNVELYIEECLNSIVKQWQEGIEVILVNDGSTDESLNLCKEFASKYSYIKLLNQVNSGVSAARNKGLAEAVGEYIWFVDSDDYLMQDALKIIEDILKRDALDILRFGFELFEDKSNKLLQIYSYAPTKILSPIDYFKKEELLIQPWAGIYNRVFLKENKLNFYKITICEDVCFNLEAYSFPSRFQVVDHVLYRYRARENSALRSAVDKNKVESVVKIITTCDSLIEKNGLKKSVLQVKKKYDYIVLLIDFLIELKDTDYEKQIWGNISYHVPLLKNDPKGLKVYKLVLRFFPNFFFYNRKRSKQKMN